MTVEHDTDWRASALSLAAGTHLGSYTVVALLGAGGMGEVYRARDTKLDRDVALKILPADFARDPERLARFEREAKTLAALNHPHIAHVYGFEQSNGVSALVMELVEGEDLSQRIARGALPVDEALPIARQIADALEAAHEQGIIHRDLKPANVKVRADGMVKVLDFGLAKAVEAAGATGGAGQERMLASPTVTSPALTVQGVILGTAAYMSPEQAKGRPADKRADIWAFGCVLYEVLTGTRVFEGEDVSETLASILRGAPDWSALPDATPPVVRRLLRRCLERDRRQRLADIADARFDLDEAIASPHSDAAAPPPVVRRRAVAIGLAALLVATIATAAWLAGRRTAVPDRVMPVLVADIALPAALAGDQGSRLAISPDGRRLAFVARDAGGRIMLWVRPLDGTSALALTGTDGASGPFWSPDNRSIGFTASGKLKRIDAGGGQLRTICDTETTFPGAWNRDNVILFTPRNASGLSRVSATGGVPSSATVADRSNVRHYLPAFLPDDRHFVYYSSTPNGSSSQLLMGTLDAPDEHPIVLRDGGMSPRFADDRLLFVNGGVLFAQRLDVETLRLVSDAVPVTDNIDSDNPGRFGAGYSVSSTGVLVVQPIAAERSQLTWFDRRGKAIGTVGEPVVQNRPLLSPSGSEVAVNRNRDIWLLDASSGVGRRLTSDATADTNPVWSPSGDRMVFSSRRQGRLDLYEKSVNEPPGSERVLLADDRDKFATTWSADGKYLIFGSVSGDTGPDLWILPMTGERVPRPLITGPGIQRDAVLSPDGRWVAYASDESGRMEVFVAPVPGPGRRQPVSSTGGRFPHWSGEGELFFLDANGYLTAVTVESAGDTPVIRRTERLFQPTAPETPQGMFDVAADGKRLLVMAAVDEVRAPTVSVLVNWTAMLPQ